MNDDIPSRGNLLSVKPDHLTKSAPDAITPDRRAQRLLHTPAKPAELEAIGAKKNGEFAARSPASLPINDIIFGTAQQAARARQSKPRWFRHA